MTRLVALVLLACLWGCTPTLSQRLALAERLSVEAGMEAFRFDGALPLVGYRRIGAPGEAPWVFIEGDGLAWVSASQPSMNPTPVDPVSLRLALRDPADNVIYIARPGQYLDAKVPGRYWLEARFAPEVVEAMAGAIREQLQVIGTSRLYLAGYSGGGAMAALLAQAFAGDESVDVQGLVTVAGNLDHDRWTRDLGLTPLSGSLNPAERAALLRRLPQRHLVGTRDDRVPEAVQQAFMGRLGSGHCARLIRFPLPHGGPWPAPWLDTRNVPLVCP